MATYTDNYSLTKPTFAEVADIRTINGNMDTIDDIMHASQVSLAEAYDQTKTYSAGDVVMYEFLMYKCLATTTGNWDATKWERTTAAETGGGGSVDFDLYGEASGNPASFADGSESALVECETEIVPVQDLHGYDKPWAGGTGKNKLNDTLSSGSALGVDYTINSDGTISTSGVSTAVVQLIIPVTIPSGDYYFSGCVDGGSNSTYDIYVYDTTTDTRVKRWDGSTSSASCFDSDDYEQIKLDDTHTIAYRIRIRSGVDMNGKIFKPMICSGTASNPADFEPYENICPIIGYDEITINVSSTNDPSQGVDTTIQLGDTYYGGTLNVGKGELAVTYGYIASYNGETLTGEWLSDRDEYTIGGTPTTGAEVVYELATPITVQLTPTEIATLLGQNYISSDDTEDIDIVYVKASAFIKPNPSGEPDGYLSSIELSGEKFEIIKELPTFPTSDGNYKLKLYVSSGVPTLSWVSDT